MKKLSKIIIAFSLSFSIVFSYIPRSHAIIDFVLTKIADWFAASALTQQEITEYKTLLLNSWSNSNASSNNLILVSGDVLWETAGDWSKNGVPCEVKWTASVGGTGVRGYWIECTGEPYNMSGASLSAPGITFTGRHLGTHTDSVRYYYSTDRASSSYLNDIFNDTTWITTFIDDIEGYIDQIEGYIDGVESTLTNINTYVNGISTKISSLSTKLTQTNTKIDAVNTTIGTTLYDMLEEYLSYPVSGTRRGTAYLVNLVNGALRFTNNNTEYSLAQLCFTANQYLTSIDNNLSYTVDGSTYGVGYFCANMDTNIQAVALATSHIENKITPIATAINSIDNKLTPIANAIANMSNSFSVDGIHIDNSSANPLYTSPKASDLYVTGYSTNSNDEPLTTLALPYATSSDLVSYINSEMVDQPIKYVNRDGQVTNAIRTVVSSYLDTNNRIRVRASDGNSIYTYFLTNPDNNIIVASDTGSTSDWDLLMQRLATIDTHIVNDTNNITALTGIKTTEDAILAHMTNTDLNNDNNVIQLVNYVSDDFTRLCNGFVFDVSLWYFSWGRMGELWDGRAYSKAASWFQSYSSTG